MNRRMAVAIGTLLGALLLSGCGKEGATPALAPPVVQEPKAPQVAPDVSESPAEEASAEKEVPPSPSKALPSSCIKLLSCCDEWVKVTPTARVGCDAQRQAFRAAKTPDAKSKLESLCGQALEAWAQLPNLPEVCK